MTWKILFIVSVVLLIVSSVFAFNTSSLLNITRDQLETTEYMLLYSQSQLTSKTAELSAAESELDNIKSQLSLTKSQLTTKETELASVNDQLISTKTELKTAIDEKSQLLSSYESIRNTINVRFGDTITDMRSFITPSETTLSAKVQEITGGFSEDPNEYWRDWDSLYKWVVKNIRYSYDSYLPYLPQSISGTLDWRAEFWRKPAETLEDETGDCEDMALLLASMIKNYNQKNFSVWLIQITSDSEKIAHLAVGIPVKDGHFAILDPAGNYYTGINQYWSLSSDVASITINDWLSHWSNKMPGAYIQMVFSESEDKQFSSTAEFLTWLSQR